MKLCHTDDFRYVSRETFERFRLYEERLLHWQNRINLISPKTIDDIWQRHFVDSAQAYYAFPQAMRWVDLGSGAGFPGLVIAILLADDTLGHKGEFGDKGGHVDLIESNHKKAAFLQMIIRETGIPASVHIGRIESVGQHLSKPFDAVSARALAPLSILLDLALPFFKRGADGVFHKGQDFLQEIEKASQSWAFDLLQRQNPIHKDGVILRLSGVKRLVEKA